MKVYNDYDKKPEQNINTKEEDTIDINTLLDNSVHVDSSDVEVKIEELTIKSTSILEKFLNSEL